MYIAKYFKEKEYTCKCGCGFSDMSDDLLMKIDLIRLNLNRPLIITSGCRCEKHNKAVGGATNSLHVKGRAVDIKATTGKERMEIVRAAFTHGITGIGVNKSFIHLSYSPDVQEGVFPY